MPSIDTITLADCAALIFAPDGRHFDHMAALAGTLGFGHVLEHTKLNALPEKALPFFLIHNGVIDHLKQRLLRGLREQLDQARLAHAQAALQRADLFAQAQPHPRVER